MPQPLYAFLHTHWDREWYMSATTTRIRLADVMADLLMRLENGQLPEFVLDGQTVLLDDYLSLFPQGKLRIQALVKAGKLHIGPWFTAPDEWLVSGESLLRNLQRGIHHAQAFGQHLEHMTGYLPDTFGHTGDMPTLLNHVGLHTAVVWRGVSQQNTPIHFNWQGPDGSQVHTLYCRQGYFHPMCHDPALSDDEVRQAVEELIAQLSDNDVPPLLPMGGDHLAAIPPHRWEQLQGWFPQLTTTIPADYMALLPPVSKTVTGPLMDNRDAYLLTGVWSARPYLKQANRQCEHQLLNQVEPMLVAMWPQLSDTQRQQTKAHLDEEAWRQLLLNHPHDSICGCSLDTVHAENEVRFQQVLDIANSLAQRLWQVGTIPSETDAMTVWHGGDRPFTGVVPVEAVVDDSKPPTLPGVQWQTSETILQNGYETDANQVPLSHLTTTRHRGWCWVAEMPPMTFSQVEPTNCHHPVSIAEQGDNVQLANNETTLVIEKNTITIDGKPLRLLWQPDTGDSYNRGPYLKTTEVWATRKSATVLEQGLLVATVSTVWELAFNDETTQLTVDFTVKAGSPVVESQLVWEQPWPNGLLQWVVETGEPITRLTTDSHCGHYTWPMDPNYRLTDHLPAQKQTEVLSQSVAMQRWGWANGCLVITDGPPELECVGSQLRHSVLRTFDGISHGTTSTRGGPAGPPFATPGGQYPGRAFTCRTGFANLADCTPTTAIRLANNIYGVAQAHYGVLPKQAEFPFVTWDNPAIHRLASQPVDDQCWHLRLVNDSDQLQTTQLNLKTNKLPVLVNALGQPMASKAMLSIGEILGEDRRLTCELTMPPRGLVTLQCRYP